MIEVKIGYKPLRSNAPAVRRIKRSLPESWKELTPEQAWHCVEMIFHDRPRREIIAYLLQLPAFILNRIDTGPMFDLIQCINWMVVDFKDVVPAAPYVDSPDGKRLYLPSATFANVKGLEYVLCDEKYEEFLRAPSDHLEAELIAIILRPGGTTPDPASDMRIPLLSKEHPEKWISSVKALPVYVKKYIMCFLSANRQYVFDNYSRWLFEAPGVTPGDQDGIEVAPSTPGYSFGWWGAFMDVAEDKVFGTYEQVLHTDFHNICMHMIRKVQAARERKQAMDHAAIRAGLH